jgi:hypothetical protein
MEIRQMATAFLFKSGQADAPKDFINFMSF